MVVSETLTLPNKLILMLFLQVVTEYVNSVPGRLDLSNFTVDNSYFVSLDYPSNYSVEEFFTVSEISLLESIYTYELSA